MFGSEIEINGKKYLLSLEGTKNDRDIFKIVSEEVKEWWGNLEKKFEEKIGNIQKKNEEKKGNIY